MAAVNGLAVRGQASPVSRPSRTAAKTPTDRALFTLELCCRPKADLDWLLVGQGLSARCARGRRSTGHSRRGPHSALSFAPARCRASAPQGDSSPTPRPCHLLESPWNRYCDALRLRGVGRCASISSTIFTDYAGVSRNTGFGVQPCKAASASPPGTGTPLFQARTASPGSELPFHAAFERHRRSYRRRPTLHYRLKCILSKPERATGTRGGRP